jgi:DNA polymerase-1
MKDIMDIPEYEMILVDAVNLAARNYHMLDNLSYEGHPTGMLYGVMKFVLRMQKYHPKAQIIFLWEGVDSKRKSLHTLYKANRNRNDDSFRSCLEEVRSNLTFTGVTQTFHLGLEADDVAGHLCYISEPHQKILMVTTDEDWFQYMKPDQINIQRRNNIETFNDIKDALGFPPNKIGMWKILKGDKSDDIPGVKGFPSLAARLLVNRCETYKDFLEYPLHEHNEKWAVWEGRMKEQWETVIERNAELILFHPEWIEETQIMTKVGEFEKEPLISLFEKYNMKSLIKEVEKYHV